MHNLHALQEMINNRAGINRGDLNDNASTIGTRREQLSHYESIFCLLDLLFIDDTRLKKAINNLCHNTSLQKVINNLCHNTSIQKVINSLCHNI